MLLLAIDTAGPACAVALVRAAAGGAKILARTTERIGRGHAERLMPMIEAALGEAGVIFADLDRIAVTTGPGSFTGVRIGVAAARGLALALDIPAVGVGSLEALSLPVSRLRDNGTLVALLDARRSEVYALAKDLASGMTIIEPVSIRADDLAQRLVHAPRPLILAGAGAPILAAALRTGDAEIVGAGEFPDIDDVAALGLEAEAGSSPVPLYLRGADAKAQADKALARR